jgi:hypothetical protein
MFAPSFHEKLVDLPTQCANKMGAWGCDPVRPQVNIETDSARSVEELVQEAILKTPDGSTISVKAIIAAVREDGPHLVVGDATLIELIVEMAPAFGRALAFDLHE